MARHDTVTEPAIAEQVARFYAKVRQDPEIGPLFNAAIEDWDAHLEKLAGFWSSVMLRTGRYKGDPMEVHMRQPIRPAMFDRWLALWGETAQEVFAPELAQEFRLRAERIASSLKLGLFYRPDAPNREGCPAASPEPSDPTVASAA